MIFLIITSFIISTYLIRKRFIMSNNQSNNNSNHPFSKDDAYRNLERVNYWINNADTKTNFILTFLCVSLVILFSNVEFVKGIQIIFKEFLSFRPLQIQSIISMFGSLLFVVFLFFIVMSIKYFLNALSAKISTKEFKERQIIEKSILFFNSIKENDNLNSFLNLIKECDSEEKLLKEIHSQTLINSLICSQEFDNYNNGINKLKGAGFSLFLLLIFLFIRSIV